MSAPDGGPMPATMPPFLLQAGAEIPSLASGPFTLVDFVRWTAYQENWLRIHYDRVHAAQRRLPDIVQSGHHRTALITRMLTDWLGERGVLRRLRVRHTALVRPGDAITCGGRITMLTPGAEGVEVTVTLWVIRQDGTVVSEGEAMGYVPHVTGGR